MLKFRLNGIYELQKFLLPNYAIELEKHIYDYCSSYVNSKDVDDQYVLQIYNTKLYEICFNLNQRNSPLLIVNIMTGVIQLSQLPSAGPDILNPVLWGPIKKKREYIQFKKDNLATTKAYKCYKCGQRKCSLYHIQTRSADEPMTIIVMCQNCNNSFRIG